MLSLIFSLFESSKYVIFRLLLFFADFGQHLSVFPLKLSWYYSFLNLLLYYHSCPPQILLIFFFLAIGTCLLIFFFCIRRAEIACFQEKSKNKGYFWFQLSLSCPIKNSLPAGPLQGGFPHVSFAHSRPGLPFNPWRNTQHNIGSPPSRFCFTWVCALHPIDDGLAQVVYRTAGPILCICWAGHICCFDIGDQQKPKNPGLFNFFAHKERGTRKRTTSGSPFFST